MSRHQLFLGALALFLGAIALAIPFAAGCEDYAQGGGKAPSIWLLLGSLTALALGVMVLRVPRKAAARRARRTSAFEAIVDAAARTRNLSIVIGLMLIVFAGVFAAIPVFDRTATSGAIAFIEVLAALTLGLGLVQVRRGYRLRDPRHNELLGLIEERPHEIAWLYVQEVEVRGGGKTLAIHLWKTDGKLALLMMIPEDIDIVMGELSRRAPHAQVGYRRDIEKLYREKPSRWAPIITAALVLAALVGCEDDPKDKYLEQRPEMQQVIDAHAAKLAPVLPELDRAFDAMPVRCAAPLADADVVSLPRDFADRLVRNELKALSLKPWGTPFMTSEPHRSLLGDTYLWSATVFDPALETLRDATLTGIYLTGKLDTGKISGRTIARPGYFEGSFVLLDLARKQVVVRVLVKATTSDFLVIDHNRNEDAQLARNLEGQLAKATAAALDAAGCGKLQPI